MTKQAEKEKENYFAYALAHLVIDMDESGTFAKVPSQARPERCYKVQIDESDPRNVHAVSCNCLARKHCKHMSIVNSLYRRILRHYLPTTTVGEVITAANEAIRADEPAIAAYLIDDCYKAAPSQNDLEAEYVRYQNYEMSLGA